MMGSGKSSVGRQLAVELGVPFVDLDVRIERLSGTTIAEAFEQGEAHFRGLERLALRSLVQEPGFTGRTVIVATGGGAVLDARNRACMDAAGARVLLSVPLEELAARLAAKRSDGRPLLTDADDPLARLERLWAERRVAYEDVPHKIDGVGPARTVALRVAAALDLELQTGETP